MTKGTKVIFHRSGLLQLVALGLATFALATSAAAGTLSAELSQTTAGLGEVVLLAVTVEGATDDEPTLKPIQGLDMEGAGVERRRSVINGQVLRETTWRFGIRGNTPGTYEIPKFTLEIDGQAESSLPLTLTITNSSSTSPQAGNRGQKPNDPQRAQADGKDILVERKCETTTPFVGQQVLCTIRVMHRVRLVGGQRQAQSTADFRRFMAQGEEQYDRDVNGKPYRVIELTEIVVPRKAGELKLPPFELLARVLVMRRGGSPFDRLFDRMGGGMFQFDLGSAEEREVTVASEVTPFTVKPLPDAGKPDAFAGIVGSYQVNATVSPQQCKVGETVTITINLSGNGLLDTASITPDFDQYGKVYPDKDDYQERLTRDAGIVGTKTFRFALVPTKAGSVDLGTLGVPVFEPKLGQYVTLQAPLGLIDVAPGDAEVATPGAAATPVAPGQQAVKALAKDQLTVMELHRDDLESRHDVSTGLKLLVLGGAVSMIPGLFALGLTSPVRKRASERVAAWTGRRKRRTGRAGESEIEQAEKLAKASSGDGGAALERLAHGARAALGEFLGVPGGALTPRDVANIGAEKNLSVELIAKLKAELARLDELAYRPAPPDGTTVAGLAASWRALLKEIC